MRCHICGKEGGLGGSHIRGRYVSMDVCSEHPKEEVDRIFYERCVADKMRRENEAREAAVIQFSGPILRQLDYMPYMEIHHKARLSLDPEMYTALRAAGVVPLDEVIEMLVGEFRDKLKEKMPLLLKLYGVAIDSTMDVKVE